jgi:hypothetical protein
MNNHSKSFYSLLSPLSPGDCQHRVPKAAFRAQKTYPRIAFPFSV